MRLCTPEESQRIDQRTIQEVHYSEEYSEEYSEGYSEGYSEEYSEGCSQERSIECNRGHSKHRITASLLMERAGRAVFRNLLFSNLCPRMPPTKLEPIWIFCGPGNNGADGFVVARLLIEHGYTVRVQQVCPPQEPAPIWLEKKKRLPISAFTTPFSIETHQQSLRQLKAEMEKKIKEEIKEELKEETKEEINTGTNKETNKGKRTVSWVVDAIFGTGLNKEIPKELHPLFDWINSSNFSVIAVDAPSGLDAGTGRVRGKALRAHRTVTFGVPKAGFFLQEGPHCVGSLSVDPLLFPKKIIEEEAKSVRGYTKRMAQKDLPGRDPLGNKSTFGKVLVIAGSQEFPGAGRLTTTAAFRSGAGYVYHVNHSNHLNHSNHSNHSNQSNQSNCVDHMNLVDHDQPLSDLSLLPEVIPLQGNLLHFFQKNKAVVVAIGPGLEDREENRQILRELHKKHPTVVLDAEALSMCEQMKLWPVLPSWIATPHSGELGKILNVSAAKILSDPLYYVKKATEKMGCYVLLKGFHSVVAAPPSKGGPTVIILSGNAALAKAGSGDVLTGMIAAFLAQKLSPMRATCLAAYVHGYAADQWVRSGRDVLSLTPSDLVGHLPRLLARVRGGNIGRRK